MSIDRNRNFVLRQLAALQKMSLRDLKEKWRDLYGSEPPDFSRAFLLKRLAYRIQELHYGGISEGVYARLSEMAEHDKALFPGKKDTNLGRRPNIVGQILPGTRLVREWNGNRYEVLAAEKGFEYSGKNYRSLSAIASEITGTKWNGKLFFGLRRAEKRTVCAGGN
ncbi:MAG: hypothetical protein A2017_20445 [Lentisphaerae bacterium GWF2_44_16]|nr:MAG: hypothetical protein A2017_20445 [Lentisphaerae bacterium GWF2_44_16]